MEYMPLGSLYDVLHNELITEIPNQLKIKVLKQAAKGMYFLHSSGICHGDLKSLNLLLDSKWNTKVSDFGFVHLRDQYKKQQKGAPELADIEGSIQWRAPEILSESITIANQATDVYSFGIILWEAHTRLQPYTGMR